MRTPRLVAAMVLVAAGIGAAVGRADAHICPVTAVIPLGQVATVTVAVTVEAIPVPDVEMEVPAELRLDRVDPSPGWSITQQGQTVRYKGPPIAPFTCKYFSIGVTAHKRGAYAISVTQRDAAGTVVARSTEQGALSSQNPYFVQHVYAGENPPSPSSGASLSLGTIAGAALVGLGVIFVAVLAVRAWLARRADEREEELDDRVEEFKKQARDRSRGVPS